MRVFDRYGASTGFVGLPAEASAKAGWRCLRVSIPFLQLERLES
jgi:hypothetical protein